MKKTFLLLLLTAALAANCDSHYECLLNVEGRAGAIWWKPCGSMFQYANTTRNTPNETKQLIISPEYQWGFQVYGGISDRCDCNFANIEWTNLNATTSVRFDGPDSNSLDLFLLNAYTLGGPTRALHVFAKQKQRYNKLSLKGGHTIAKPHCGSFYTYVGGRWVQIKETQELRSQGTGNLLTQPDVVTKTSSRINAGGVEAGIGGDATIYCGVGLRGHVGIVALIGRQESGAFKSFSNQVGPSIQLDPAQTICTGGLEVRGGFYGSIAYSCAVIELEIGYELDYYFRTLRFRRPIGSFSNILSTDIGFGGPYISLGVSF